MGTLNNVFKILLSCKSPVEVGPCTLPKTYICNHMVDSHFQVKGKS